VSDNELIKATEAAATSEQLKRMKETFKES